MTVPSRHTPRSTPRLRSSRRLVPMLAMLCAAACSENDVATPPPIDPTRAAEEVAAGAPTTTSPEATAPAPPVAQSGAAITAANLLESERDWPDIVALVEPWTPEEGGTPLKKGFRGALLRVEDDLRVRIAFGRHGHHDVPLQKTDLLARANEIRLGTRHKLGPNFVVHFGAQFVDTESAELAPYPTPRLLESSRFLCVFADPRSPAFRKALPTLKQLEGIPGLRTLVFPLQIPSGELGVVRDVLAAADWRVPFAYPGGADVQARALLGDRTNEPVVLLLSPEGRVLLRSPLAAADWPRRIRSAASPPSPPALP